MPADRRDVFDRIEAEFHRLHRELYGFASPGEATMIVNLRVTAIGKVDRPRLRPLERGDGDPGQALKGRRSVDFSGAVDCPIFERSKLDAGDRVTGPAIIEQMDTTIVLPPDCAADVDASGCLIIGLSIAKPPSPETRA